MAIELLIPNHVLKLRKTGEVWARKLVQRVEEEAVGDKTEVEGSKVYKEIVVGRLKRKRWWE